MIEAILDNRRLDVNALSSIGIALSDGRAFSYRSHAEHSRSAVLDAPNKNRGILAPPREFAIASPLGGVGVSQSRAHVASRASSTEL